MRVLDTWECRCNSYDLDQSVYKKRGNNMTLEQIKQFKEENCSKCNKDIDCKITQDINGKLKCTED